MDPADSWEQLGDALLGPFEREIIDGLTGAYRALEPKIEQAFKRSLAGGSDMPLRQLLFLRQELEQELSAMRLPPNLAQVVNQSLIDGQKAADFWALAEMNKAKQAAKKLTPEQAAEVFANATNDTDLLLTPSLVRQNPSAMIAAAQRSNALSNYAAGGRGTQAFASLNRLVDVDLRGRIIGAVEFHLASGDSWRQLRSTLQNSVELTKSRAQTVARTEMAAAMVEGTKLRYEAEGIQQVQWQAVGSSRTCGYCAPRHGKVYKLGDVIAPAHPNCRCTVTPFDPKWVELGLIDLDQEALARSEVLADLKQSGKQPISGPSPFEKALGLDAAPQGSDPSSFQSKGKPKPKVQAKTEGKTPETPVKKRVKLKSEVAGSAQPSFKTDNVLFDYSDPKNAKRLGYGKPEQLRAALADVEGWSGADYEGIRAQQFRDAGRQGVRLSPYQANKAALISEEGAQYYAEKTKRLEEFVKRAPKYDGPVYRGVALKSQEDVDNLLLSFTKSEKALTLESWSSDQQSAKVFADGDVPARHRVMFSVDRNKHGAPIASASGLTQENEVLLPSGVRYEVADIKVINHAGDPNSKNPWQQKPWTDYEVMLKQLD